MSIATNLKKAARPARTVGVFLLFSIALYFVACAALGFFAARYNMPIITADTSELEDALPFDLGLSN